jgi:cell division protein FtsB
MFGNKAKHALAAAQAENAQLKAQADTLQGELAATQARLAQLETQARECPEFCVNQPLLFDQSIVGFGRVP